MAAMSNSTGDGGDPGQFEGNFDTGFQTHQGQGNVGTDIRTQKGTGYDPATGNVDAAHLPGSQPISSKLNYDPVTQSLTDADIVGDATLGRDPANKDPDPLA